MKNMYVPFKASSDVPIVGIFAVSVYFHFVRFPKSKCGLRRVEYLTGFREGQTWGYRFASKLDLQC